MDEEDEGYICFECLKINAFIEEEMISNLGNDVLKEIAIEHSTVKESKHYITHYIMKNMRNL